MGNNYSSCKTKLADNAVEGSTSWRLILDWHSCVSCATRNLYTSGDALVAQWIEHLTTDQKVVGSTPAERTKCYNGRAQPRTCSFDGLTLSLAQTHHS